MIDDFKSRCEKAGVEGVYGTKNEPTEVERCMGCGIPLDYKELDLCELCDPDEDFSFED